MCLKIQDFYLTSSDHDVTIQIEIKNQTMLKSTEVFEKTGDFHSVSQQTFYGMVSGFTIYGLAGSAVAAHLANQYGFVPGWMSIIILGLVAPISGIIIASASSNWFVSFIGYNLVLVPFGLILGPVLNKYDADVVRNACALTATITFVMGLAGTLLPNIFSKIGSALFFSLCSLLLVRIAGIFIPQLNELGIIDYIAAGIFSLYIGYDMYRASVVERNLDNAVDIALSLYLDIVNLFLEILKITGDGNDD